MSECVRIGVIGAGMIGTAHAKSLAQVPLARVAAMADPLEDRLEAKCDELGVEGRYTDYKRMLKEADIDAVVVGVPNFLHLECSLNAFRAGKHVLLEKPMAMNAREGRRICAAAEKAGRLLQMGMVRRFSAPARVAREYVQSGVLGEVYHMRITSRRRRGIPGLGGWFTTKAQAGGGGLIDIGVHAIDLAMWASGCWEPTAASAAVYGKFGSPIEDYNFVGMWAGPPKLDGVFDVDDYASALVRFGLEATLQIDVSWAGNCDQSNGTDILGDKGGVRIVGNEVTLYTEHEGRIVDIKPQFPDSSAMVEQDANFVQACLGKAEPCATGEQGVALMSVLDAIYKSGETGREVKINV